LRAVAGIDSGHIGSSVWFVTSDFMQEPTMTLCQIRRDAQAILPGCGVTRHALWRYSVLWPEEAA
jgi:hypothetical protein